MLSFLKNHPFAVEAFFETSLVLTFAVPKEELEHIIPECLTLDTFDDKWAFIAIAMVQTKDLRPKGFPKCMGNDFFLVGYRIFVRFTNDKAKKLRGLYILKSETDKRKMQLLGNTFTHYNYTTTDITQTKKGNVLDICSLHADFHITVDTQNADHPLPTDSPFPDWKAARKFAGPLPFTFTYNQKKKEVLIIEGVRQNWTPQPVKVYDHHISFLKNLHLKDVILANAFIIHDIPYYWKKGKIEQWNKEENFKAF